MIDSKVLKFLNDIKFNNNRKWFNKNKQMYKEEFRTNSKFYN